MSDYKYCWGYEKDDMCNFEDTIKQCLKEAADYDYYDFDGIPKFVYIGEYEPYEAGIDGESFIDELAEDAWNVCDEAETWLDDVTREQAKDLEDRINAVIAAWLEETANKPHFGAIENIRCYEIETGRDVTY